MNVRSFPSHIFVFIAALLFSFGAFQVAYAADGDLGAASASTLKSSSADVALDAQAETWRTISTPEELRVLNLKSEGFGPGYYKIGNDFTLGGETSGDDVGYCALLKGNFVIDFNGHTVQSSCENISTFVVKGANVTFMDSGASSSKVSVNALGMGCIDVREGSATIQSGNYLCSNYFESPAVCSSGGTITVNGGAFQGTYAGLMTGGGSTVINGGKFYGGYPWAFFHATGTSKIIRGEFYAGQGAGGYNFAIGATSLGQTVDFSQLFADGSTLTDAVTCYWNGTSASPIYMPIDSYGLKKNYAALAANAIVVSGPQTIKASNVTKKFGDKPFNLNATTNGDGKLSYSSSNAKVATVNSSGTVTLKGAGKTSITIKASATNISKAASKTITLKVNKAANTLKAKGLSAKVSAKKVAKKARVTKKLVKVTKNKGKVTYKKASGSKALSIGKANGKVTVKKGTKKGTYKIKVKVSAAGNALYKAGSKTVTVTVKVK